MKTLDELKKFYTNELSMDLRQLEQKRKRPNEKIPKWENCYSLS